MTCAHILFFRGPVLRSKIVVTGGCQQVDVVATKHDGGAHQDVILWYFEFFSSSFQA